MNKRAISGRNPRSIRSASNALTTAAFSVAPKATASTCLSPAPSMPIAATRTWSPTRSPLDHRQVERRQISCLPFLQLCRAQCHKPPRYRGLRRGTPGLTGQIAVRRLYLWRLVLRQHHRTDRLTAVLRPSIHLGPMVAAVSRGYRSLEYNPLQQLAVRGVDSANSSKRHNVLTCCTAWWRARYAPECASWQRSRRAHADN
jgi:hypothetical protein